MSSLRLFYFDIEVIFDEGFRIHHGFVSIVLLILRFVVVVPCMTKLRRKRIEERFILPGIIF